LSQRSMLIAGWWVSIAAVVAVRLWNALTGPFMWGYDGWGHVAYMLFLDLYRGVPFADQGWSYFHPPFHYALGAALAQFGSGDVLMRGVALLGSAASLGTAALTAFLVRRAVPDRPALGLLAFVGVACLPVHLYVSPMPGNKLTETFLSSLAIVLFAAGAPRRWPRVGRDVAVGAVLGCALLTAFSAAIALGVIGLSLGFEALVSTERGALRSRAARGCVIAGVAILICGPYYARNVTTFGNPFRKSSDFPAVQAAEAKQPPGSRGWRDHVSISPRMFGEPDPLAPHMIHSIWGSAFASTWADVYRQNDVAVTPHSQSQELRWRSLMLVLGVVPSGIAALGFGLALGDVRRGRRRSVYFPALVLAVANAAAFAAHAHITPTWAALKAYYLLGASLAYGVFLARGIERLAEGPSRLRRALGPVAVGVAAVGALALATEGALLPARGDSPATGPVRFYFEEYEDARRIFGRLAAGAPYPVPWLDNLAAIDVADGRFERAARLYTRAEQLAQGAGREDPYRTGRRAVATALAGDVEGALGLFETGLAGGPLATLLANRGAVRATTGDLRGAARDLGAALAIEPALVPAWLNRAEVLSALGEELDARDARTRAAQHACRPPRNHPYGLGSGEVLEWGISPRWLLLLTGNELRPALLSFYREACHNLAGKGGGKT